MKNVYLAGPMRGIPQFNFPAFMAAAKQLQKEGYHVFNPADRDIKEHGSKMATSNKTGDEKQATKDHGFSLRDALGDETAWIKKMPTLLRFSLAGKRARVPLPRKH
jgi:hypothetical protein